MLWSLLIVSFILFANAYSKQYFEVFQNPSTGEFGVTDENDVPCLILRFHAKLYNFNLNSTDIATEISLGCEFIIKIYFRWLTLPTKMFVYQDFVPYTTKSKNSRNCKPFGQQAVGLKRFVLNSVNPLLGRLANRLMSYAGKYINKNLRISFESTIFSCTE